MSHDCSACSGSGQAHHAPCVGEGCAACRLLGSAPCGPCEGTGKAKLDALVPQDPAGERDRALRGLARARGSLESLRAALSTPAAFPGSPLAGRLKESLELVQETLDETTAEALGVEHVQIDLLAEEDAHVE